MKKDIRAEILKRNRTIHKNLRQSYSQSINREMFDLISKDDTSIALFYPMETEPDIVPFIEKLLEDNRVVSFPKITNAKEKQMAFYAINSLEDLSVGKYGILSPSSDIVVKDFDVVITPVVGIDKDFKRLGMGGGFYDRFFEAYQALDNPPKFIAPIYDENMNLDFEGDKWDIVMDYVVTEKQVYKRDSTL